MGTDGDGEREILSCKKLKHGKQDMLQASSQIMVGIVDVLLDRVDGDVKLLGNLPLALSGQACSIHLTADIRQLVKSRIDHRIDLSLYHLDSHFFLDWFGKREAVSKVMLHTRVFQIIQYGMVKHLEQVSPESCQAGKSLLTLPNLEPCILNQVGHDIFVSNILHAEILQTPEVVLILLLENTQVCLVQSSVLFRVLI